MKRKTFVKNIGICSLTFAIAAASAIIGIVEQAFIDKSQANANSYASLGSVIPTIVIDAGHGGADGGAVGVTGVLEKDINLEIAKELSSLLELCGFDTVLTRQSDVMLSDEGLKNGKKTSDLNNRVKIAKSTALPVFISIHQNKFPLEKYKGLQVWYSKNNTDSAVLAEKIQNNTVLYLQKDNNRKVKQAGRNIFVLHKLNCPAVLVECGFLSNPEEEKLLCDRQYRRKIAFILFASVSEYISENYSNYI